MSERQRANRGPAMSDNDRRVRRTRRILHEALISLILEKGYERTTVQDVLDRADVGRSTFYAHFRDKEALLVMSFDGLRDDLRRELDASAKTAATTPDPAAVVAAVFAHSYRHRDVYRALCGRQGGTLVYGHLHRLVGGLLSDQLRPHLKATGSDLPVDVAAEFYTSAALGLLTWSVDHDHPYRPAELAAMYRALAAGPGAA
jgi:AcrR family transcriptional regulator